MYQATTSMQTDRNCNIYRKHRAHKELGSIIHIALCEPHGMNADFLVLASDSLQGLGWPDEGTFDGIRKTKRDT
jgi:hypothetical protein